MMIGIAVAALALVAAATGTLRGGSSSSAPTQTQVAYNAASTVAKAPTLTGSADSADTALPKSAAEAAAPSAPTVEANPQRVVDRTLRTALQQSRYERTGEAFSTLAEVSFSR